MYRTCVSNRLCARKQLRTYVYRSRARSRLPFRAQVSCLIDVHFLKLKPERVKEINISGIAPSAEQTWASRNRGCLSGCGVEGRQAVNHRNPRVIRAPLRARVDTTHGCSRLPPTYVGSPPRTTDLQNPQNAGESFNHLLRRWRCKRATAHTWEQMGAGLCVTQAPTGKPLWGPPWALWV